MITFKVEDMSCGGCVRAIRTAVAAVAPQARVEADVGARRVTVEGVGDAASIGRAIVAAGFSAVREADADAAVDAGAPGRATVSVGPRSGCCCGPR